MPSTNAPATTRRATTTVIRGHASHQRRAQSTNPPPTRDPERSMSAADIAALGVAIAEDGLRAHRELVRDLAAQATAIQPVAAAVLASEFEPDVARFRAFALVASALVRKMATAAGHRRGTV